MFLSPQWLQTKEQHDTSRQAANYEPEEQLVDLGQIKVERRGGGQGGGCSSSVSYDSFVKRGLMRLLPVSVPLSSKAKQNQQVEEINYHLDPWATTPCFAPAGGNNSNRS